MRVFTLSLLLCVFGVGIASSAFPQGTTPATPAAPAGPPLFLKEDWKHTPDIAEHAVVQESVTTPDVELKLYGQTRQYTDPDREGKAKDAGVYEVFGRGITYIYTGPCLTPCAVALRNKTDYANLTGQARVRWRTRQSGFHFRVRLSSSRMAPLVGDYAEVRARTIEDEFSFSDIR